MKKTLSLVLALVLVLTLAFSMVACGGNDDPKDTDNGANTENNPANTDTDKPADTDAPSGASVESAVALLEKVWNELSEDYKFFAFGGNVEAPVEDAPGSFSIEDAAVVDTSLGFPAASIALIDDAASLIHMMNANTLTMAAYHVKDAANLETAVKAIEDNISNRQWMCGFPELLSIVTVDGQYVVSIFGAADIVNALKTQITTSYPGAVVSVDKALTE